MCKIKVMAISSRGHWVQLLRLRLAFAECDVAFATMIPGYRSEVGRIPASCGEIP
jgi:hypothetical protein